MGKKRQFIEDMSNAGFDVDADYYGRYDYQGPAVRVVIGDLQTVIESTGVRVQWDKVADGYVVYPLV